MDPENVNGLNLYCYCGNDPVNYCDPSGHSVIAIVLSVLAVAGLVTTGIGVATDNNTLTAIGLTMVAVPAIISGIGAIATGATYLGIIGGVTCVAGMGSTVFAATEYIEAFTGNNWMINAGMSEEWYNRLLLTTATIATIGTISCNVLSSIGKMSTPKQMTNSFTNHPNRWKVLKEQISDATGRKYRGGTSIYSNNINRWTGARASFHRIIRDGVFIHGPHFHELI